MKIKIQDKKVAQELAALLGGMEPEVQEGEYVVNIDDKVIKRKYKLLKAAYIVESGANKVARVGKTGARTTKSLVKATARAITAAGSTLVKSAKEELKKELKK